MLHTFEVKNQQLNCDMQCPACPKVSHIALSFILPSYNNLSNITGTLSNCIVNLMLILHVYFIIGKRKHVYFIWCFICCVRKVCAGTSVRPPNHGETIFIEQGKVDYFWRITKENHWNHKYVYIYYVDMCAMCAVCTSQ